VSRGFARLVQVFPLPILGVILLFQAVALLLLARDVAPAKADFAILLSVGLAASSLPYGYLIGLIGGTLIHHCFARFTPQSLPVSLWQEAKEPERSVTERRRRASVCRWYREANPEADHNWPGAARLTSARARPVGNCATASWPS
jgi:hypothetical protein